MAFTLFGIPVRVRPAFWLVTFLIAAPRSLVASELVRLACWVAVVFVSILAHELGHAFAMRAFGRTASIELVGMGGLTSWGEGPAVTPGRRALVSLAGPCAGFALAAPVIALLALYGAPAAGSTLESLAQSWLWVNVGWGLLNLLPIWPLDGGHVLEVALMSALGERGGRVVHVVSIAVAGLAIAAALHFEMTLAALLAGLFLFTNVQALRGPARTSAAIPARATVAPEIADARASAWAHVLGGRAAEGIALAEDTLARVAAEREHAETRASLLEVVAWGHVEAGDDEAALAAAARFPPEFVPSPLLAARLTMARGEMLEGIEQLEREHLANPSDVSALVLAATYIDVHRARDVVAMLRGLRAIGLASSTHLTISAALFYAAHYEEALAVSELSWNRFASAEHAYNAGCSCARLGRVGEGLTWIERAIRAGYRDRESLEGDEDLAALRGEPEWELLMREVRASAPPRRE